MRELAELTRAANRANATYTIDPQGLVAGADLDQNVDPTEWANYVRKSQDSLRTLAELTGGFAVVNQNDFDKALKRIDNETSDYYVVGYSSNPDPTKRNRKLEVKTTRDRVNVWSRGACRCVRRLSPRNSPPPRSRARAWHSERRPRSRDRLGQIPRVHFDSHEATPRRAHATAVLHSPRNGPPLPGYARGHAGEGSNGQPTGNVAGCGRSSSRSRWSHTEETRCCHGSGCPTRPNASATRSTRPGRGRRWPAVRERAAVGVK